MAKKSEPAPREKRQLVCVGLAVTTTGKLRPMFRALDVVGVLDERELIWEGVKHASPGCVYEVEIGGDWNDPDGNRQIFVGKSGKLDLVREWPNEEQRALWEAIGRTARTEHARAQNRKKTEEQNRLRELVRPLARIYDRIPYGQRVAFLTEVQYLISSMRSE